MGQRIIALAASRPQIEVVAALEMTGHPQLGADAGQLAGVGPLGVTISDQEDGDYDVMIEFSLPNGTMHWLERCKVHKKAIVIGTTGHSDEQLEEIEAAAHIIPLIKAANMSVGINLLLKVVAQVAQTLGDAYDIEISETHHRFKKDAPSGTALALRDSILQATGRDKDQDVVYGRHGAAERATGQVGMHALRMGSVVGEHDVHFGNLEEIITIGHSAQTRDVFAAGSLRAAAWLTGKQAGRYDMFDVLGLK
jgi:4-hydroxy-tetrahydrodipicolinate reductase